MTVSRTIKGVFLVLACTILGVILYDLFFSYNPKFLNSAGIGSTDGKFHAEDGSEQHGVIWEVSERIQEPIAFYYYNYCYMPNYHSTDALDKSLGLKLTNNDRDDTISGMSKTESDLSTRDGKIDENDLYFDDSDQKESYEKDSAYCDNFSFYSTGWR